MSGCPFGGKSSSHGAGGASPRPLHEANREASAVGGGSGGGAKLPTGRARIKLLYEEYIHLPLLRQVWEQPGTEKPVLEPMFAAGFHGIELAFLLLAEFISDGRRYVAKRPRVELVADDIATQCQLLTEVCDAELEEELQEGATPASRLSLTQDFPFEGCPPTKAGPCHSPGLQRLTAAVCGQLGGMTAAERNSLIRLVLNITAAFSAFQRWTVGLGIEWQLNELRAAVGLPPLQYTHRLNLDYDALVKPWLCEQTLTCETYTHAEDFFFRTIHLGTDCWAFVVLSRLRSAHQLAEAGNWHAAAARATQASRILHCLGSHVHLLTSMNLRDYLFLKVEIEGTSGEGSVQVKSFRPTVRQLFQPLVAAVLGVGPEAAAAVAIAASGSSSSKAEEEGGEEGQDEQPEVAALQEALMVIYEFPDQQPGLYNYCKALEALETGLLGGFYYKHYCLATNVIGSAARGTMKRAVSALKAGYEAPVFGLLDRCRVALGARIDAEVAHRKGLLMDAIMSKYQQQQKQQQQQQQQQLGSSSEGGGGGGASSAGCPFGFGCTAASAGGSSTPASTAVTASAAGDGGFEVARQQLYSWQGVPPAFQQMVAAELAQQAQKLGLVAHPAAGGKPLAFLDHAWGQMAPQAQYRAWREAAALHQLGNPAWDAMFGRVLPQAAAHIRALLGLPPASSQAAVTVQFGSNSHELVGRLLSVFMDRRRQGGSNSSSGTSSEGLPQGAAAAEAAEAGAAAPAPLLRVLTSDTEFYSITRQLNRLAEAGLAAVDVVPAEPAATFPERCCVAVASAGATGQQYDFVYLSQTTYLTQRTLIPSIPSLVRGLRAAATAAPAAPAQAAEGSAQAAAGAGGTRQLVMPDQQLQQPMIIIDGYHGFCALPTDLSEVAEDCCYVAGLLKHAGCGANCAFVTLPARLAARPVLTGWLADPSVLAPGSSGIQNGSEVGYCSELALQGGTPSYLLPLLTFNHLQQLWQEAVPVLSVEGLHDHVVTLHQRFLQGLDAAGHPTINSRTLLPPQDPAVRSHTLSFALPDAAAAKAAVDGLAAHGIQVDTRKAHVRFGFGANHSAADVDALLAALRLP